MTCRPLSSYPDLPCPMPDVSSISLKHIGQGFHKISQATAVQLCKPYPLPRMGYYLPVVFDGFHCEIHRTIDRDENLENPKHVWSIMVTSRKVKPVESKNHACRSVQ